MTSATVQRFYRLLFALAGAGAIVLFALMDVRQVTRERWGPLRSPLAALPAGAALVVTADWKKLEKSALGAALSGAERELSGVGPIGQLCGFDPASAIQALALSVAPRASGSDKTSFGIAVMGDFESAPIVECAKKVIIRRGGKPVTRPLSSFTLVAGEQDLGHVAVRSGGPVLISDADYLRSMVRTAEGQQPDVGKDELHYLLQKELGTDAALVLSWILPADWLRAFADGDSWQRSPLSTVRAIAARVDVHPNVALSALVACVEPVACRKLVELLRAFASELSDPTARLGVAPQVRLSEDGHRIRLVLELPEEQAATLVRWLFDWARTNEPMLPDADRSAWPADELIRP